MAVRVALTHKTSYTYERPAALGPQVIRLRPAPHNRTPIHSYSLRIEPKDHFLNWQQDPHGNYLARVVVPEKARHFEVLVDIVADLQAYNPFDFFLEPHAEEFPFDYSKADLQNLESYLKPDPSTPLLTKFLRTVDLTKRRTVDFLVDLNQKLYDHVEYVIRMEPGVQAPEFTLESARGSCRDSAWLLVQVCRHLGLAARFVSGYLIQLEPDERPIEGPRGPEKDFTDLHAWTEVYVPGAGWVGLDPTSGLLTAEGHIPLACSPSPGSAAPVEGGVEKVETAFDFEMKVTRVIDVPRVTRPYTEEQWQAILERGSAVDLVLEEQDLRLTQGGEPTFVGTQNPDAPEWNTEALGEEKLGIADSLSRRLQTLWSPGGLFHHGQGKWYPGEQLPRWAISVVWRADGQPVWRDQSWFALSGDPPMSTTEDAERFITTLADVLRVGRGGLMPAYEDAWYYMWRERRLPTNVDPLESNLADEVERARLAKVFRQGLNTKVGFVLPLGYDGAQFFSGRWFIREEHCFLIPGDSPIGYRLPLDSLPWFRPVDYAGQVPMDPTVKRPALPPWAQFEERLGGPTVSGFGGTRIRAQRQFGPGSGEGDEGEREEERDTKPPKAARAEVPPVTSNYGLLRTAICAEVRNGILRLFMPPILSTEGYLELCVAIERTCEITGLKVQLEGYAPPSDPRLRVFKITPDPGVIEVNVPPVSSWDELVRQNSELYEAATFERLTAQKFELDGRHIGSGGGNHLVLGANTPLESPFLRRPDLLRSLLTFWHNHPSLSYLFSGQFIGPTSQAPRIDEARTDAVYELELAFKELSRHRGEVPPWLVDRILRNILVDSTGNTHRTEFCIDKLYSPDGSSGRLGLLEMRAFEMPPHYRMATAQHLLLRSALAAFARHPYEEDLVKWGTTLSDRFLLPHFVHADFKDALAFLHDRGFSLDPEWFEPHYQFRFPYYGSFVKDNVVLEVRGALEPWHVLGEEGTPGGQARYVDSSLERVQVKLKGATPGRHVATCNGVEIPLHPTDVQGEFVAGIRYRAWQPPSCLHPTIGTDGPLHIDLYDRWNKRAIAGCSYHIVHPGGRANEVRPVNAVAAESRRIARFDSQGHLARSYVPIAAGVNHDFPMTLDLRSAKLAG